MSALIFAEQQAAQQLGRCHGGREHLNALRGASAFTQKTPPQQLMFRDAKAECDALAASSAEERAAVTAAAELETAAGTSLILSAQIVAYGCLSFLV
jgi:hypothetical protein